MTSDQKPNADEVSKLQHLEHGSLIGGTLDPIIKAQAMAAQTSWKFINEIPLTNEPNTKQEKTD